MSSKAASGLYVGPFCDNCSHASMYMFRVGCFFEGRARFFRVTVSLSLFVWGLVARGLKTHVSRIRCLCLRECLLKAQFLVRFFARKVYTLFRLHSSRRIFFCDMCAHVSWWRFRVGPFCERCARAQSTRLCRCLVLCEEVCTVSGPTMCVCFCLRCVHAFQGADFA